MKLKGIISGLIAVTAIGLMATVAHAETYSVTSAVADAQTRTADINVVATPDTDESGTMGTFNINGYVIYLEYNPQETTPVLQEGTDLTGGDVYAVAGADFNTENSVLVSGIVDSKTTATSQTLAISWASKDPVTVDAANEILSSVEFKVEEGVSSADIDLTVGSVTSNGTDAKDSTDPSVKVASGTITLDHDTFVIGDETGDELVTSDDVIVLKMIVNGYTDDEIKAIYPGLNKEAGKLKDPVSDISSDDVIILKMIINGYTFDEIQAIYPGFNSQQ